MMSYVGGDQRHDKLKSHHPDLGALQAATPGCHEPVEPPRPISAMPQSIRKTLAALLDRLLGAIRELGTRGWLR